MRLVIQIPCYNEEDSIAQTIKDLPKKITGVEDILVVILDDGSSDNTAKIAVDSGVDFVFKNRRNRGLANTFSSGIDLSLLLGADIIVNTDGDNQYKGSFVADLVKPIIQGEAEIVIGARPIKEIEDFSALKKFLQKMGSSIVSLFAGINVPDTTSGFRAYSRDAAMSIAVVSSFTYTLETIIQAGRRKTPLVSIPIKTNKKNRESRLFGSSFEYVLKSIRDIVFISTQLKPLLTFGSIGVVSFLIGVAIGIRFLALLYLSDGVFIGQSGHVQSLILSAIFILFGSMSFLIGLLADQIAANRIILEKLYEQNRVFTKSQNINLPNIQGLIYVKDERVLERLS